MGVDLLAQVRVSREPWIAIIDTSIDVGVRKAIVILRVLASALEARGSAMTLEDCEVFFLKIVESSTGEVITKSLESAFQVTGQPMAVLKDGGGDLMKGTRVYIQENKDCEPITVLADLGHYVGNLLKAQFSKRSSFKRLLTLAYGGQRRLRQTKAALFLPPKLRSKGRFQGISHLADWGLWVLDLMAFPGAAAEGSTLAALRKGFSKLTRSRGFIEELSFTCKVTNQFQELLKNRGLNDASYAEGLSILAQLPVSSPTRQGLQVWLTRHLGLQCKLKMGKTPLLVSSDPVESLTGKLKAVVGLSSSQELNRMTFILPTACGHLTSEAITRGLEKTSDTRLKLVEREQVPPTMLQQRRNNPVFARPLKIGPKTLPQRLTG